MYITPSYETSLDPDDAIALNPNEIPLVTFRKRIIYRLGQPYGQCRKRFPSGLTHFIGLNTLTTCLNDIAAVLSCTHYVNYILDYTKKQCMYQCLINQVEAACKCSSALFPKNLNEARGLR